MKIAPAKTPTVLAIAFSLFFILSCSKDSDVLADYVSKDPDAVNALGRIAVNDSYQAFFDSPLIMDVLENDTVQQGSVVTITETTPPENGTVEVNPDNTVTYTPETTEPVVDTFEYTVEETQTDGTVTTDVGSVTVDVKEPVAPEPLDPLGTLKAFPGAEGFGKNATGGRGGIIVEVTNLNDSGSGSLREALKMTQKRTIIFKVSGIIECNSYLSIPSDAGNVTVAGQTAPGDGITIKGAELRVQASNVIIRYLKIRPGDETISKKYDGLRIVAFSGTVENVIADHVSVTWAADENLNIGGSGTSDHVRNVTVQNSIIGENISSGYGVLLWNNATNISIYRNLLAHNSARNIRSSTCTSDFEMINNVIYDYENGVQPTYENQFDIVGNTFITDANTNSHTVKLEASTNNCPNGQPSESKAYIKDNLLNGGNITVESQLSSYLEGSRIFNSGINPMPASQVESSVLAEVGAKKYWDAADLRIINDVKNGTGSFVKSVSEAGGYPTAKTGVSAYSDSDKDGIDDAWEVTVGLDPNNASDGKADRNDDGYSNLEEFLHYLTLN